MTSPNIKLPVVTVFKIVSSKGDPLCSDWIIKNLFALDLLEPFYFLFSFKSVEQSIVCLLVCFFMCSCICSLVCLFVPLFVCLLTCLFVCLFIYNALTHWMFLPLMLIQSFQSSFSFLLLQ